MDDLNRRNNNSEDMSGEAALVVAARGGQAAVLKQLLAPSSHASPPLCQQTAALYAASRAGQLEAVKYLIDYGVNVDTGIPEPPILAALSGGHSEVAMLLIHHGADCDVKDSRGNSCLHLACAAGLYDVVRCLCAMGCTQNHNLRGQYPLHIAARNGFIHIVRLLCFYGCKIDQRNGDGIRADITALKYGHNNIAELLDKLRVGGWSAGGLRSQLGSGKRPLVRLQVRFLGHSGSGKTALAASLNAGLLHALLRRSTSLTTRSRPSSPSQSSQIEMDVTPRHNSLSFDYCTTPNYIPTKGIQVHQMDLNSVGDITVWDFSGQEAYFQIYHHFLSDVSIPQPATVFPYSVKRRNFNSNELAKYTAANDNVITNIGKSHIETTIDNYLCYKSNSFSSVNCTVSRYSHLAVYAIMFNLEKPYYIQLQQCTFWLNFIISKQSPCSTSGGLGNVILIGSHADLRTHKTTQGDFIYPAGDNLLQEIQQNFASFFKIHTQVLALDCNASTSVGLRSFKSYLASVKKSITQGTDFIGKQRTTVFGSEYDLIHGSPVRLQVSLGNWNGFLESTLSWIISVRKTMESFPVMDRRAFMENIRCHVNLLASDDHISDVIHHLHVLGEILFVGDVVVLCCSWLCGVLGALLGRGGLREARALGVYTAHDFQAHFGYCDASQLLGLLQEMRICTMCDVDDEIEYEFPCFNFVETLEGLWDSDDPRYQSSDSCYGGLKLSQARGFTHLLATIFPHIQVQLRDEIESLKISDNIGDWGTDCDLYQWWHGSKISWLNTECLLTLDGPPGGEFLDIRVRGPPGSSHICFLHLEKVLHCIYQALGRTAPGLSLEYSVMSAYQLRTHCEEPYSWSGSHIITKMLQYQNDETTTMSAVFLSNPNSNKKETLENLICFDSPIISEVLEWCLDISVRNMNPALLSRLSIMLDPPHHLGAHWCMLAVALGVSQDSIAAFDAEMETWHTQKLLMAVNCSIGTLLAKLQELGRVDAAELIMSLAPLYRVTNYRDLDSISSKSDDDNVITCDLSKESNASSNTVLGSRIHTDV